jgi:hypothetical protein
VLQLTKTKQQDRRRADSHRGVDARSPRALAQVSDDNHKPPLALCAIGLVCPGTPWRPNGARHATAGRIDDPSVCLAAGHKVDNQPPCPFGRKGAPRLLVSESQRTQHGQEPATNPPLHGPALTGKGAVTCARAIRSELVEHFAVLDPCEESCPPQALDLTTRGSSTSQSVPFDKTAARSLESSDSLAVPGARRGRL